LDPIKSVKLKIFMPFSGDPKHPIAISVNGEALVKEVIGYCLFEYTERGIRPPIPSRLISAELWSLRIVDDGDIDEDFPALDRERKIKKFAFTEFALCHDAAAIDLKEEPITTKEEFSADSHASIFLKIHLYSTLEVKQTTTMQFPSNIPMSEVFLRICIKRKYDPKDYILKMGDTKSDVPMEILLEQIKSTEFCVLKKSSGAGDIFLRPPEKNEKIVDSRTRFSTSEDYRVIYRVFFA
jgi:hypothetical protein